MNKALNKRVSFRYTEKILNISAEIEKKMFPLVYNATLEHKYLREK